MPSLPSWNDSKRDLWLKIANNYYEIAMASGIPGLNAPNWNDSPYDLIKRVAYYSATLA